MATFQTTYTRRDVTSIYDYLKEQAKLLSNGAWTDFSSGDIGSVLLGLMAYLADQNNFQLDKTASELFLDTAVERSSLIALLKLVGYEPRHYASAYVDLEFHSTLSNVDPITLIPAYTSFTNQAQTITYTTLENIYLSNGEGIGRAYEGTRVYKNYLFSDIDSLGRIYLDDYKIGFNTVQLYIPSVSSTLIPRVDDVKFTDGDTCFSIHMSEDAIAYIQLPSFWADIVSEGSTIYVSYLLCNGEAGRVGSNIITRCTNSAISNSFRITNPYQANGGYFPETVDEIKINAPKNVRTMDTIVTKSDLEDLVSANLPRIASIKAGDYNDDWTGYVQPDDAYKCKVLATPSNYTELSIYDYDENGYARYSNKDETVYYWVDLDNNVIYDMDYNEVVGVVITDLVKVLSSAGREMVEYIDERRLSSLMMTYEDPIRLTPHITLNVYTDPSDLRTGTIAESVFTFMTQFYDRENLLIGQSLYGSTIGRDLLNAFPEITYVEVVDPEMNIPCEKNEYIDMYWSTYTIYVNDVKIIDARKNTN